MSKSRVPTTRIGRLVRLGFTAGEMVAGGVAEGVKRLTGVTSEDAANVFLTATNAEKLAKRLAGMRGAAMKMGQIMSMESVDILPREFSDALAILRDSANTMPHSQIRRVMGREYGKGWEAKFKKFDFEPVAAASIGQVHRVLTRDGRDLALKIQYPGVAKSINSDVDNMAMFLRMARILPVSIDVSGIMAEAKRQLRQEADYLVEAKHLRDYRRLVADDDRFVVPKVHEDLTTKRILAMDYVSGEPLEKLGEDGVSQERRDHAGALLEHLMFRELFEFRTMQTDPNFANYFYRPEDGRIVLLDFGSTVTFTKTFTSRYGRISKALIEEDEGAVRHYAEQIGYLQPGDSPEYAGRILDMIRLICEPIRHPGVYHFGESDLVMRARDAGIEMMWSSSGELRAPPPETVFLHRKLVGSFLLCARIKARVDVQALISEYL
ncbi:MAG: AarF/ABC1/UbiB kinase family protein [Xanthomonadales bacterium]|nr:AarF/ABC1/UbiB kinase family protein [Gammaproteobacteria bacterium]MBT8052281.1 AarF/ABC1/UbiB kinase family protein [Gammaproteobacteria bacterium]NND56894.1 AarF/ABC1/UbiB kinase family protein [Xanthomonadales bacterium]NNK51505.1 AarF/ABC1/UbiB kinase family protein [Xanthomonadales bacterium]